VSIDPARALGATVDCGETRWAADDIILYHLAVGAGVPPTDPNELDYTYERGLKVLPTYGVTQVAGLMAKAVRVPGLEFDVARLLHGEHDLQVLRPLPIDAQVTTTSRIAEIYDKRTAAIVVVEFDTRAAGETLMRNRFSLFLRGEGGFGGTAGPTQVARRAGRPPDVVVEVATMPQQALLYRLTGDKHPLHADPRYAAKGGFDRPILHGLCTYGIACKAAVDRVLGGDTSRVSRFQARFAGVVYPGETVVTSMWDEGSGVLVEAEVKERPGAPVLTNGLVTVGTPE
jgi:acyl dehydratase